jgi:hypothetical protein
MKSTKKLKAGQLKLPTLPTLGQKQLWTRRICLRLITHLTRDELSNVMNALTEDFTDYNYNITGERNDYTIYVLNTYGTLKYTLMVCV